MCFNYAFFSFVNANYIEEKIVNVTNENNESITIETDFNENEINNHEAQENFIEENLVQENITEEQTVQENILDENSIKENFNEGKVDKEETVKNNAIILKASQNNAFSSKKGFFYINIYGNGKETKRKIEVTLSSTDKSKTQIITFKEVAVSGFDDSHNLQIITNSTKTQATEQNTYSVFSFKFSYTKPAHFKAGHYYSNKTSGNRFNFNKSATDSTTTVNNMGHNASDVTEIIQMQINLANCGITFSGGEKSNATGHIVLNKDYYAGLTIDPNGGVHDGKTNKYNYGIKCCTTEVTINNPKRKGFAFIGWTFSKGSNCNGATFSNSTSKFKYCGTSMSNSSISNNDICTLKAEWIKNDDTLVLPETGLFDFKIPIILLRCDACNNKFIKN